MMRSLLYVPANSERFLAKAHERNADAIILDLEDGVVPAEKVSARAGLAMAASRARRGGAEIFVRINTSEEHRDKDAEAAARVGAFGLFVPKVREPQILRDLDAMLEAVERALGRAPLRFVPMIEDPGAVLDARAIATASPRVLALVTGGEDLSAAMDAKPDSEAIRFAMMLVHFAAKAAGVASFGLLRSIADFRDLESVRASAREARAMGFDGATCVHPAVVPILNEAFSPSPPELERARAMVAAFEDATAKGLGAFLFDGKMVDLAVYEQARRTIARAGPHSG